MEGMGKILVNTLRWDLGISDPCGALPTLDIPRFLMFGSFLGWPPVEMPVPTSVLIIIDNYG